MADVDPATRSRVMSRIRGKNTKSEITVRKALHAVGFRFRLHDRKLTCTPDVVLPRSRTAVFVRGCFWHQHPGCKEAAMPTCRVDFWGPMVASNRVWDEQCVEQLTALGGRSSQFGSAKRPVNHQSGPPGFAQATTE
nr:very short patch repair endonuclease [Ramlibacter tataouinensis]